MADDKLVQKLAKLKMTMQKWYKELDDYKDWALENDGIIDAKEQAEIDRRVDDITAISMRIAEIERKKGLVKEVKAPEQLQAKVNGIEAELDQIKALLEKS